MRNPKSSLSLGWSIRAPGKQGYQIAAPRRRQAVRPRKPPLAAFSFLSLSIRSALLKDRLSFGFLGCLRSAPFRLPGGPLGIPCSAGILFQLEGSFPSGGFRCFRCGLICRLAFFPRSFSNLALGDPGVARRDDRFSLLPSLGSFRAFGKSLRALQLGLLCLVGCAEAVTEVREFRSVHLRTALYPSSLSFTL